MRKKLKPRNSCPKSVEPELLARPRSRTLSKTRPLCSGLRRSRRRRLKSLATAVKSADFWSSLAEVWAKRMEVICPKRLAQSCFPFA